MKKILLTCASLCMATAIGAQTAPQLRSDNIDEIVNAMTLREKATLIIGPGNGTASVGTMIGSTQRIVPGAAGTTYAIPRFGIPATVLSDGPAGVRIQPARDFDSHTYYSTHFPIGTNLASSWNTELVKDVTRAMGNEALEYGIDVLLAPGNNIHRNPLCGRNYEYFSEDPVLSGNIAAAYIQGVQSNGVGTSLKHFAFNNQETRRWGTDARLTQRAAREIYLKPFEIAVKKGKPWTVMSSYNSVNGEFTALSHDLLEKILRDDWEFDGIVMSDWGGIFDPVKTVWAGNDLIEPGDTTYISSIVDAVKAGKLDEKLLDRNVKRILEYVVKTLRFKGYKYSNCPDLEAHARMTRQSAAEGSVLLKNNGVLPLDANVKRVALFGFGSYNTISGGSGSGNVNSAYSVSLVEGMRNMGYQVDMDILSAYNTLLKEYKNEAVEILKKNDMARVTLPVEICPDKNRLEMAATNNDLAIVTFSRQPGEGKDVAASEFALNETERKLLETVSEVFHRQGKNVVTVLNIGSAIETASWKEIPDAILLPWQGGLETGNTIADILSGKNYPSGHLPMTFPVNLDDHKSSENFVHDAPYIKFHKTNTDDYPKDRKNIDYTNYEEGIYVGYRWFDTQKIPVSYPFGFGLSYTTFEFKDMSLKEDGHQVWVSVTVQNTGKRAGKQVAQVYVKAPVGKIEKPEHELKGFAKTKELQPSEEETLVICIDKADLASFDEKRSAWVTEDGQYIFKVGDSSRNLTLQASMHIERLIQTVSNSLKPQNTINSL